MRRLDAGQPSTSAALPCDAGRMVEVLLVVAVFVIAGIAQWWGMR